MTIQEGRTIRTCTLLSQGNTFGDHDFLSYNLLGVALNPAETDAPPSSVMVAPLTYAPAREDKNSVVPATSSGVPMRRDGFEAIIASPIVASVCAITVIEDEMDFLRVLFYDTYFCFEMGLQERHFKMEI